MILDAGDWPPAESMADYRQQLLARGERRLVLVEGDKTPTQRYATGLLAVFRDCRVLWVGPSGPTPPPDTPVIQAHQATTRLGSELDVIIWNGWQGNPPDAFAALSGTLAAGGLLIWLMPPLDDWSRFADPDYARTGLTDRSDHPFAAHLAQQVNAHYGAIRLRESNALSGLGQAPRRSAFRVGDTPDQLAAIAGVVATGEGRRRRPLVIRANRGRGKSTALGRGAAQLLVGARKRIIVTAPSFSSVETLFSAAANAWPQADREGQSLADGDRCLQFLPPDVLLRENPDAGLVLVDEAAALPAPILEQILTGWPRVVFATTVHGYEGTGRGFDVRFRAVLDRLTPQWQSCWLHQPIRWVEDDPLEALIDQLFLLDAEGTTGTLDQAVTIEPWQPEHAKTPALKQAFGLLTDAHYRTTPGDLRQWLDDRAASSWVAHQNGDIVGVLWVTREGGLPPELAGPIMRGERRLRGHLLAQSLASHGGMEEATTLHTGRVVRIAVADGLRRQGIGQRLMAAAQQEGAKPASEEQRLDLLGTSFGATAELVAFWESCGLQPLRLGLHQSASSGEMTVQMGLGLSATGTALVDALIARFAEHWSLLLRSSFSQLPTELVWKLMRHWSGTEPLSTPDWRELAAFADGYRLFELSLLPLTRLTGQPGVVAAVSGQDGAALWCRAILQGWSWQALQESRLCTGRKQGVADLRRITRELIRASLRSL